MVCLNANNISELLIPLQGLTKGSSKLTARNRFEAWLLLISSPHSAMTARITRPSGWLRHHYVDSPALTLSHVSLSQEAERDAVEVAAEPAVEEYLGLLHQAAAGRAALRSATFVPKYALPFLQPGRLVRLLANPAGGETLVVEEGGKKSSTKGNNGSGRAKENWSEAAVWGIIINFERLGSAKKGAERLIVGHMLRFSF